MEKQNKIACIERHEKTIAALKKSKQKKMQEYDNAIQDAEKAMEELKQSLLKEMLSDGVVEDTIVSDNAKYKLKARIKKPKVVIPDVSAVPDEFIKISSYERKTVNKTAIKKYIEENPNTNFAHMSKGEYELVIVEEVK